MKEGNSTRERLRAVRCILIRGGSSLGEPIGLLGFGISRLKLALTRGSFSERWGGDTLEREYARNVFATILFFTTNSFLPPPPFLISANSVRDVDIAKHNNVFASAGNDGMVYIWDERNRDANVGPIAGIKVSDAPVSGCKFESHGTHGGGNWIVTSDETGRICMYDIRTWGLTRVLYDSNAANAADENRWEGSRKTEMFRDVRVSDEGWLCAVTEAGYLHSWDPARNFVMSKTPTHVKATCMGLSRIG
jgi:WD40 repeat protein